jgi:predicted transposase YbfD/YdcC
VDPGSNEIIAARTLLGLLDLNGALVTADAIHCNAETARTVLDRGGHYLLALKANRPATLADVERYFADPAAAIVAAYETVDANHGRIETRRHDVVHNTDWLFPGKPDPNRPAMPGVACIGRIQAEVERDGRRCRSTRYYLSSSPLSAERLAEAVRAHWKIENGVHWVLDNTFDEDRARNRKDHGPENLATIRKLALNVLQIARTGISIRRKRKRAGWSDEFARSILGQMR